MIWLDRIVRAYLPSISEPTLSVSGPEKVKVAVVTDVSATVAVTATGPVGPVAVVRVSWNAAEGAPVKVISALNGTVIDRTNERWAVPSPTCTTPGAGGDTGA